MKHLLTMSQLSTDDIHSIINRALIMKKTKTYPSFSSKMIANLFFENSTRTQYSFEIAEHKLNMKTIKFNPTGSSLEKGETFKDTVRTFDSYNLDAIVIRSSINNYWNELEGHIKTPIINAGDGTGNHPSQCLLDLVTIKEHFNTFENLNIMIVGDIVHSRVANSNIETLKRLGANIFCCAPSEFQKPGIDWVDFEENLPKMDVVMLLRIQFERHNEKYSLNSNKYNSEYGLNKQRVEQMKENSIIMHPAPFNRGYEIDDYVADHSSKNKIFVQSGNGVWTRMAIIEWILKENQ